MSIADVALVRPEYILPANAHGHHEQTFAQDRIVRRSGEQT